MYPTPPRRYPQYCYSLCVGLYLFVLILHARIFRQDEAGVESTPPTFRMYTTGDIFEALGEDVMLRCRDGGGNNNMEEGEVAPVYKSPTPTPRLSTGGGVEHSPPARPLLGRQVVSLVEIQVVWIGGQTHLLGWLDVVQTGLESSQGHA